MHKVSIRRMMILVGLYSLAANFAHPAEPTFFLSLGMPDWMFGVAFACMAAGSFLMSPLWGRLAEHYGASRIMTVGLYGYAAGQLMFCLSRTAASIIIARLIAGFFTSSFVVGEILYLMRHSEQGEQGRNLAAAATVMTVMSAFGYMIGGLLGDRSVYLCFHTQWISLALIGLYAQVMLSDGDQRGRKLDRKELLQQSNPFQAFAEAAHVMTVSFALFLGVTALTSFAGTAFDNCFNYFIIDQFNFPPSMNGWVKGAVALITLAANSTISVQLMKRTDIFRSIIPVLAICTAMAAAICGIRQIVPFLTANIIFFGFSAVYKPLLQAMIGMFGTKENQGIHVGVYNSLSAIGTVAGSLTAGFVYGLGASGPRLSFVLSAAAFLAAVILASILAGKRRQTA